MSEAGWGVPWRWRDQTSLDQQFPLWSKTQQASFPPSTRCWSNFTTSRLYSNQISPPELGWLTSDRGKYYLRSLGWGSDERWHERWVHHLVEGEEGGQCDVAITAHTNDCCWALPSNKATTPTHLTDVAAVSCRSSFPYLCSSCLTRRPSSPPSRTRVVGEQTWHCALFLPLNGLLWVLSQQKLQVYGIS